MNCTGKSDCLCGCCAGVSVMTPQVKDNPPGLPAIYYRTGTWATFKESMLARLSSSDYPALSSLKTRDDDDFTIAFLDATAIVLDVLTFYQERLANESYLRTAGQLRSLTELSRLIGYQPAPGVSAATYLAFSFTKPTGQPTDPTTNTVTIPRGTQAQSVPAQGQKPQTFETSEAIQAKADWSTLAVQTSQPWDPPGANSIYLSGTTTQLQPGDSLLILGVDRENWTPSSTPSEQWDVVVLNKVRVDGNRKLTYIAWNERLVHQTGEANSNSLTWTSAKVYAFRQKAALFGHNAPNPNLFVNPNLTDQTSLKNLIDDSGTDWDWKNYVIPSSAKIDLDSTYQKVVAESWLALVQKTSPPVNYSPYQIQLQIYAYLIGTAPVIYQAQLYKIKRAASVSVARFGISGKVTEVTADFSDSNISKNFPLQSTEAWCQSEALTVAEQPLDYPLYGRLLDLADLRSDLVDAKAVAVTGTRQKIVVADGITSLSFKPNDSNQSRPLKPGDVLTLTGPVPLPINGDFSIPGWSTFADPKTLNVEDAHGRPGTIANAALMNFTLAVADKNDPVVSEIALVESIGNVTAPYPHTRIQLKSNLLDCYDRTSTSVNANVALADHGQSVSEILGSGNASTANQKFTLKQTPLTYIQAPTPTGKQSTLQVQVDGVSWTGVPSLFEKDSSQQVFATLDQLDGSARIIFGDGIEGATLPAGQNNIRATYRVGSGSAGNVGGGTLTTLMDRPLGVSGVINPQAATGGQDAESVDDIRSNAPQTVLTLGRVVSIDDYQSMASTFAGIAKAYAIWIPAGPGRGVFLTVAGVGGAALPPGNPTLTNLVTALKSYGNPRVPITVQSFVETLFGLSADVAYDPAFDMSTVRAQVLSTLSKTYCFALRTFGQGVSVDEVASVIQAVRGVLAVNVKEIHTGVTSAAGDLAGFSGGFSLANLNNWLAQQVSIPRPFSDSPTRICPFLPVASVGSLPQPAEILVLDPNPASVVLGVMS